MNMPWELKSDQHHGQRLGKPFGTDYSSTMACSAASDLPIVLLLLFVDKRLW